MKRPTTLFACLLATICTQIVSKHACPSPYLTHPILSKLSLRGGASDGWDEPTAKREYDNFDLDSLHTEVLGGDIERLNDGYVWDPKDLDSYDKHLDTASYQYQMTRQFLVLQNIKVESKLPGGDNCSYADSWFDGDMWDDPEDDEKWTRSAWIQVKRAKKWQEMPPIWKRLMKESWDELQEFMGLLALPDNGRNTAKFRAHAKAWKVRLSANYIVSSALSFLGTRSHDRRIRPPHFRFEGGISISR